MTKDNRNEAAEQEVKEESTSPEAEEIKEEGAAETNAEQQAAPEVNVELTAMNDKYLRLAAELENTRRRSELDAQSRARNRAISVAEKILPVMDAVDAALKHTPDDAGIKSMAMALEISLNFLATVCSELPLTFLIICWVMVLPPPALLCIIRPPFMTARSTDLISMPECS